MTTQLISGVKYHVNYVKADGTPSVHAGVLESQNETHFKLAVDAGGFRSFIRANVIALTVVPAMCDDCEDE